MFNKLRMFALILLIMGAALPANVTKANAAQNLILGSTVSGVLDENEEQDLYRFTVEEPGAVEVDFKTFIKSGVNIIILAEDEVTQIDSREVYGASETNPLKYQNLFHLEKGDYFIKIDKYRDHTGGYELKTNFKAAKNNEMEPNQTTDNAQPLVLNNSAVKGFMSWSDGLDVYKMSVPKPGRVSIDFKSYIKSGVNIEVLDSDGVEQIGGYEVYGASETNPLKWTPSFDLEAGDYYIKVDQYRDHTGTYELKVNYKAAGNTEAEPNETAEQAKTLAFNKQVTGFISWNDELDVYKVVLPKAGRLTVDFKSFIKAGVNISVLAEDGATGIAGSEVYGASETNPLKWVEGLDLEAGIYFIKVDRYRDHTGTYELKANFAAANNSEKEGNQSPATANALTFSKPVTGFISWQDELDMYKVTLAKPGRIALDFRSNINAGVNLDILNRDGVTSIYSTEIYGASETKTLKWVKTFDLKAGTYYLKVDNYRDHTGKYSIQVNLLDTTAPGKPSINRVTSQSTYITGKAEAYSTVTAYIGKSKLGSATADKSGNYKIKITKRKAGTVIIVNAKDKAGNVSANQTIRVVR